jgi:hypothetical protein
MSTRKGLTPRLSIAFLIIVMTLSFAALARSVQAVQPSQGQDKPKDSEAARPQDKPNDNEPSKPKDERHYSLTVIILAEPAEGASTASPVKGAIVRIFVGDYHEASTTGSDGKVLFDFDTRAKTATVRVEAEHFSTDQEPVALNSVRLDHKVVLKKSD